MNAVEKVAVLIEPSIEALGYEMVGVEMVPSSRGQVLRVYIDHEAGITLDDCKTVSYQVSGVLDVEDPIAGAYSLEVSSPGMRRPLFKPADYDRFAGSKVRIQLKQMLDGRRNFKGVLKGIEGEFVLLEMDEKIWQLPLIEIKKAHLEPDF